MESKFQLLSTLKILIFGRNFSLYQAWHSRWDQLWLKVDDLYVQPGKMYFCLILVCNDFFSMISGAEAEKTASPKTEEKPSSFKEITSNIYTFYE